MNRYRVEILGVVPNGLTHNDVHASVSQILNESVIVESIAKTTKSKMVSLVVTFQADNLVKARTVVNRAITGVSGFSADSFGFRDMGSV